jgi:hypothetical protein
MEKKSPHRPSVKFRLSPLAVGAVGLVSVLLAYPIWVIFAASPSGCGAYSYGCALPGLVLVPVVYLIAAVVVLKMMNVNKAFPIVALSSLVLLGALVPLNGAPLDNLVTPGNILWIFVTFALLNGLLFTSLYYYLENNK